MVGAKFTRCAHGEIDDPLSNVGPAIVDPHDHRLARSQVDYAHLRSERERAVGRGHGVYVKAFTAGGAVIPIPRGDPGLHVDRLWIVERSLLALWGHLDGART